jgi:hypothetical protein
VSDQHSARDTLTRWGACRVVVYLLLALLGLDLVVVAHSRLWRDYDIDPYDQHLDACRQPWDLVLVGASPVMYGADPAVLSGTRWRGQRLDRVYNLGLVLATASEIYLAVEHGLAHPPRLLVYGVSATDFNDDRVEPHGPRHLMSLGDALRWSCDRPDAAFWCAGRFASHRVRGLWGLYAYRDGIRLWAADQAERICPGACPEVAGEARAKLAANAAVRAAHGLRTPAVSPETRLDCLKAAGKVTGSLIFMERYCLGAYLRYLDRLLDDASRRGIPVVLVDMPVPADLDQRLYPGEFQAYRAALAAAAKARGVTLLSATREAVGLSEAEFADQVHLNAGGAARFSAWLRRQLEQM